MGERKPGLRERKKADKLARIRAAARTLFAEGGFEGTTTRAISEAAGIGTGTLFSYFRDKRALLVHLFDTEVSEVVDEGFASLPRAAPVVDQLLHLFGALYRYYDRDPRLAKVFVREIMLPGPADERALYSITGGFVARLAALLAEARADGRLAPGAPEMLGGTAAFGHYVFVLLSWLGGALRAGSREGVLRELLEVLVRGMAVPDRAADSKPG